MIHVDSIEGARKILSLLASRPGIRCTEKATSTEIPLTEERRRFLAQLGIFIRASSAFDPSCLHPWSMHIFTMFLHISTGRYI